MILINESHYMIIIISPTYTTFWSDYYRFPINTAFAAYLLESAILVLSRALPPFVRPLCEVFLWIIWPYCGAFTAFPEKWHLRWGRGGGGWEDGHAWSWLSHYLKIYSCVHVNLMISGLTFTFIQCLVIVFNRVDQPGAETITKCSCNRITEFLGLEVKTVICG